MTVIPYWNMPHDEIIHEALRSDDELVKELGERLLEGPSPEKVDEMEGELGDFEVRRDAAENALFDLYALIGFDPKEPLMDHIGAFHGLMETRLDTLEEGIYEIARISGFGDPPDRIATDILPELHEFLRGLFSPPQEQTEQQTTPEVKEPEMSLETRMESLETRLGSLEESNSKLADAIERLIVALSTGPVPTAAAARTRKSANTNKKDEPAAPAAEEPAPAPAAQEGYTKEDVLKMLTELPREEALRLVGVYSPTKVFSGVPAEKYPALVAEIHAYSQKEAA